MKMAWSASVLSRSAQAAQDQQLKCCRNEQTELQFHAVLMNSHPASCYHLGRGRLAHQRKSSEDEQPCLTLNTSLKISHSKPVFSFMIFKTSFKWIFNKNMAIFILKYEHAGLASMVMTESQGSKQWINDRSWWAVRLTKGLNKES